MRGFTTDVHARTWPELRVAFDSLANKRAPVLAKVTRTTTTMGGVPCEWFEPKGLPSATVPDAPVVIYLHGGAYIFGSTTSYAELISRIGLAVPARVLAPNYRLAPEHPFPSGIDDVVATYRALVASGVSPSRIVVGGDSAGGGLTTALMLRLREAGDELPRAIFLVCPWVDLTADGGSLEENARFDWGDRVIVDRWKAAYLNGHDPKHPLASPAHARLERFPPTLVQVGAAEILLDQATLFARRAKEAGVDVELVVEDDMVHDWHSFAGLFEGCGKAIEDIGTFVRKQTHGAATSASVRGDDRVLEAT